MFSSKVRSGLLAGIACGAIAVPFLISTGNAQGGPPPEQGRAGPGQPQRPGNPMPPMGGMNQGMPFMGGGATMIDDANFIYILRGPQLLKVQKNDLRVVAQTMLPMPEMPVQPRNPVPPGGPGRGPGGGNRPPG